MNQIVLTKEDILTDIEGFEERIRNAKNKLAAMSETASTSKERKKIMAQRRIHENEIVHVQRLISYAKDALREADDDIAQAKP